MASLAPGPATSSIALRFPAVAAAAASARAAADTGGEGLRENAHHVMGCHLAQISGFKTRAELSM